MDTVETPIFSQYIYVFANPSTWAERDTRSVLSGV